MLIGNIIDDDYLIVGILSSSKNSQYFRWVLRSIENYWKFATIGDIKNLNCCDRSQSFPFTEFSFRKKKTFFPPVVIRKKERWHDRLSLFISWNGGEKSKRKRRRRRRKRTKVWNLCNKNGQKGKEEEGEHGQKFETYVTKMAKTGGVS